MEDPQQGLSRALALFEAGSQPVAIHACRAPYFVGHSPIHETGNLPPVSLVLPTDSERAAD